LKNNLQALIDHFSLLPTFIKINGRLWDSLATIGEMKIKNQTA